MGHTLFDLARGMAIASFSGVAAFYGGSIAYQIVRGSLGFDVIAWIYAVFTFLIGFLCASIGGERRYVWIGIMMTPVFLILLLILTSSLRETGSFSPEDMADFIFLLLFGCALLVPGIGFGVLLRRVLGHVMPPSVWNRL